MSTDISPEQKLEEALTECDKALKEFKFNAAFGLLLDSLTQAAAEGIAFTPNHHDLLSGMREFAADTWPRSTNLGPKVPT